MEYQKLHRFILFVLLLEGKSNLKYNFLRILLGKRIASVFYFKTLFSKCDNATFQYYCNLFREKINDDFTISVELDSHNMLTGKIK